ncbi:unnamed protein product [Rotaria sordida]|uniref:Uncharacterized protein n=1 Tax=Rotaria sordida TaxID=392033 RepID=A0A813T3Y0_9BILA|nr:unnamed protein product [Rotaria sordida]CAF1153845.1 unnamed protein product [Rotaria sordida]
MLTKARLPNGKECFSFGPSSIFAYDGAKMIVETDDINKNTKVNWPYFILKTDYTHYALTYICVTKGATRYDPCIEEVVEVFSRTTTLAKKYLTELDNYIKNSLCIDLTKFEQNIFVVNGQIPLSISEHTKNSCEITLCVYLISNSHLVLCSTNSSFVTCWNTRRNLCLLHWKADSNEICYMTTNEFQLDDEIISGSFDNTFSIDIVGTSCRSLWYICWTTQRTKIRLVVSHTDRIMGVIPIEDTHIVTSSVDDTITIYQLEDRNEILRFDTNGLIISDGTLHIFNLLHGQIVLKLHPHTPSITAINVPPNISSFAPDGITIHNNNNNNWQSYPPNLACFIDHNLLMYIGYGIEKSIQINNLDTKQIIRTISLSQWCSCFDISNINNDENENRLIVIKSKTNFQYAIPV